MRTAARWILITTTFAFAATSSAQPSPAPADLVGCYALEVSEWSPPIGADSLYYRIPPVVRFDSAQAEGRGGWVLAPNIGYPGRRRPPIPDIPRWEVARDTVRLVWSNGFSSTIVTLLRDDASLVGEAIARNDFTDGRPAARATVRALRQTCI